jgi:hypothetical protein
MPEETPSNEIVFDEVRVAFGLVPSRPRVIGRPENFVSSVGVPLLDDGPVGSPPPREARARVSVVLVVDDPSDVASAPRLRPFLPGDAEIVIVEGNGGEPTELDRGDDRCTVIRRREPMTLAARLNLGAEVARGDVVVFAHGLFAPRRGWLPALRKALGANDVGAASPSIISTEDADDRRYGLRPREDLLDLEWITEARSRSPFPVPSLSALVFATTRQVFDNVGGFDDSMRGAGSVGLELCLRLWRSGYRCLAVPGALVSRLLPIPGEEESLETRLHDALRVALVHYSGSDLAQVIGQLASLPEFPSALAEVSAGDVGRRRVIIGARAWYDTAWVLRSLDARGHLDGARRAGPRSGAVQP